MNINNDFSKYNNLEWDGLQLSKQTDWVMQPSSYGGDFKNLCNNLDQIISKLKKYGLVLIRSLPISKIADDICCKQFFNFGLQLGSPVSQSRKLDFLGKVTNRDSDILNPTNRGYESSATLPFHTDRCDLLCLLCIRPALHGGKTRLINSYRAFQNLKEINSSYAWELMQPIPFDRRDAQVEGQLGWTSIPPFSFENNVFISRYVRRFIESSQRFSDAPRLTNRQIDALDTLDSILEMPGMSLDLQMEAGDLLILDNHRLYHARTEFDDGNNLSENKRLLLRLWLAWDGSPPLPLSYQDTYGRTEPGVYRGGVWSEKHKWDEFPYGIEAAREALILKFKTDI
ncbi:TauD/TfdA family dioxygenase [Photorhabdus luminescens]|uniref:TauD/TfdA family dioxygenase n=1 Tax=Photorhabdus luminescens TaxID=29488 RepID=UPI00223F2E03|nr:TauD/TfdA family dioxygenase [Photorhabdus luminescens]MCW7762567.1 TauD/TfdA family dioxygenase [Photorhabdus luminescens subsp. venezuelensis]